jgi:hypothetical protein
VGGGEGGLDAEGARGTEAQIDVVPEDGRVAIPFGEGAGNGAGVGMALDDFEAGFEGGAVEEVLSSFSQPILCRFPPVK